MTSVVHRPERVAQLLGIALGTLLETQHLAQVLAHPQGGLKISPGWRG